MLKMLVKLVVILLAVAFGFSLNFLLPLFLSPPGAGMMGMGKLPPPAVKVIELKVVPLDTRSEFIATIEPVQEVLVRSEVSGYVDRVHFKEGSLVQEGDLLFTIDQKKYRSLVAADEAMLESAQAELSRAQTFMDRLIAAGNSISLSDLDTAVSAHLKAEAIMKQAEATVHLARLDLAYSEIRSPINGRIGVARITKGNYVSSAAGELARIVQVDPMRVVFAMTDRAYLDARQKALAGHADALIAQVRLPNGATLPTLGKIEFTDNAMNMKTGTMAVRYLFENADEMLVAGGYVNLMIGPSDRPMGLRIPQRAVLMDTEGSYVLTVNEAGLVGMTRVELGRTIESDRMVVSGLKSGDRVIVDGVQKARPGLTATVTLLEAAQ
ncbi:MAG: efflux RND transporter periplasmic adaptor subunit [Pontiella sp.]